MMEAKGLLTALVTPVANGSVDRTALDRLIDHAIAGGSEGFVILGGTGEYAALSMQQRIDAVETCRIRAGSLPVIVGILSPGLYDAVDMGKLAKKIGADAVMVVTPYYVVADQKGLIDYYLRLLDAVDLPLILYNIPYRTLVNMQPETVADLVGKSDGRVIGIKECTPSIAQFSKLISMIGDKISFLCGEEFFLTTQTILGAKGAILATSNLIPRFWRTVLDSLQAGDVPKATALYMEILPFLHAVFGETNPGPLKLALKLAGMDCGEALPPLHAPCEELTRTLRNEMKRIERWLL